MPSSPAVAPQPVPESVPSAGTAVHQCTIPPPAPLGVSVQGAPVGLGALQPAMLGAPLEVVRLAALLLQQRKVSPWGRPHAGAAPGPVTRAASPRTAPPVAPAPAVPVALLALPRVPARLELAGAGAACACSVPVAGTPTGAAGGAGIACCGSAANAAGGCC